MAADRMLCHPHPAHRLRDRARGVLVIRVCAVLAASGVAAVVIDFVGVWIWLSFIKDGPEFPY